MNKSLWLRSIVPRMLRESNMKKCINLLIHLLSRLKENTTSAFHEGKQCLIKLNNIPDTNLKGKLSLDKIDPFKTPGRHHTE